MKLIYIAGPFTGPTQWAVAQNIRAAEAMGREVALAGHMPVIPHVLGKHYGDEQSPEFWYEGTLELMRRCDAIVLVFGWQKSRGAVAERAEAHRLGMPVFLSIEGLRRWDGEPE